MWQAIYTAGINQFYTIFLISKIIGIPIPTPIARARYFHRSLNP